MHTAGTSLDHSFHQLKRIKHATETGFSISDYGYKIIDIALARRNLNLIGAFERVVNSAYESGDRVNWIK